MQAVKIGIVEDELIIAEGIKSTLTQLGYQVAELACNYTEALQMMANEKPDLMLLDINLGGSKDGIDLAWKVKEQNIPFIFLTANADTATVERAKKTEPPAYLVKPFSKDDLYTSIEVCLYNYSKRHAKQETEGSYMVPDAIFIKDGNYFHKVKFSDILYLESEHVYVTVHTVSRKILVRAPLQQYLSNFNSQQFFRVHRSYAVNLDHVDAINADYVIIKGQEIPISKSFKVELLAKLHVG